ncbi:hypothetical protein GQR58_014110 [Nymphon striatum]|nr:hypothetical protein GQR58_014110 [Nymphon striatum]
MLTLNLSDCPPQVLPSSSKTKDRVVIEEEEDATLTVFFCSDPAPKNSYWEWGSLKLNSGAIRGRFKAEGLLRDQAYGDCFEARMNIEKTTGSDARKYSFNIFNEQGSTTFPVTLEIRNILFHLLLGLNRLNLRKKWINAINSSENNFPKRLHLYSLHFEESCFDESFNMQAKLMGSRIEKETFKTRSTMGKRLEVGGECFIINQTNGLVPNAVEYAKDEVRCAAPNVATVFHRWANLSFEKITDDAESIFVVLKSLTFRKLDESFYAVMSGKWCENCPLEAKLKSMGLENHLQSRTIIYPYYIKKRSLHNKFYDIRKFLYESIPGHYGTFFWESVLKVKLVYDITFIGHEHKMYISLTIKQPFAARGHVLGYHLATPYWRTSYPVNKSSIEATNNIYTHDDAVYLHFMNNIDYCYRWIVVMAPDKHRIELQRIGVPRRCHTPPGSSYYLFECLHPVSENTQRKG